MESSKDQPRAENGKNPQQFDQTENEPERKWGILCCAPKWMQWANTPPAAVFCVCWFTLLQGFVVNGINNVNTSSIERRFDLPSSRVGLISSAYDFSGALFVLPITFFFGRSHHPRLLGCAALIMSLGSFVMCLPHFTTGDYNPVGSVIETCDVYNNGSTGLCATKDVGLKNYLYVFILGQFLHGIGGTTLYSIGIIYIDDNVKTASSPLFTSFKYACSTLGPAFGYIIGGQMLRLYVDMDTVDTSKLKIAPGDPLWVGAWWVSFFIASFLFISAFLMFLPQPRETPNAKIVRHERISMAHNDGSEAISSQEGFGTKARDLPLATWLLIKNPVNSFVTLAAISEGMLTSGFATFMPKYLQNQYELTASIAAVLGGMMSLPGAVGGQLVGGIIARCFKLKIRGLLRMCLGLSAMCAVFAIGGLINCGVPKIAGVTVAYGDTSTILSESNLTHPCNADCNCNTQSYEPVCGVDGIQYFSPCHAGCGGSYIQGAVKYYTQCTCISRPNTTYTWDGYSGKCRSDCNLVFVIIPFFFLFTFLTFCVSVPGMAISLRCIPDNQRAYGIGLKWMFIRFLGTVPGPIIFGQLFDSVCILWQDKCKERGSCWVYDSTRLGVNLFVYCLGMKLASTFFFTMANCFYKPPPEEQITSVEMVNQGFNSKTPGGNKDASKAEDIKGKPTETNEARTEAEGHSQTRL